jgi:hypothetical protein
VRGSLHLLTTVTYTPQLSTAEDFAAAVDHYARALAVAGDKASEAVLLALKTSLPVDHYAALLAKLGRASA